MLEKFMFSTVPTWLVLLIFILSIPAITVFGWLVQYKASGGEGAGRIGSAALAIAQLPDIPIRMLDGEDVWQPQRLAFDQFSELRTYQPAFHDDGVLLVSSYDEEQGVSIAYLYDLANQTILHTWIPPIDEILAHSSHDRVVDRKRNYRTQHPLLLDNGDIIVSSGEGMLARINACSQLVWTVDRHFHHSIERSQDGNLFVPILIDRPDDQRYLASDTYPVRPVREDGFAKISMDGEILREWSGKDLLERQGYIGLLYGVGPYESDRFHINDVQPIWRSDQYVQEGDLIVSIRNLSTVLLYRPTTDEIVWLKTGPWLNQHDVDYQGNGIFTILGNDTLRGEALKDAYRGYSTIWQYDQRTNRASAYLPLGHVDLFVPSQGVHRVLANGDVFIEDSDHGLIHRVSADGLRWSYAHGIGDGRIGALHWSRYLTADEARFPWLRDPACNP